MNKCKVGILFGGRSVEHDVSVISAHQVIENMNKEKYEIIPIYLTKEGQWVTGRKLFDLKKFSNLNFAKFKKICICPYDHFPIRKRIFGFNFPLKIDIAFPIIHGSYGEDGTLQGLLEMANIPYVGCGVVGSVVGMDKIIMKAVFKSHQLPILNYLWFTRKKWLAEPTNVLEEIETKLKYPVFVKPANLGSSIGINKSKNKEELEFALNLASTYDRRLIIEEALEEAKEINCSVLGDEEEVISSVCEEPLSWQDFLKFEDKYSNKFTGMKGASRRIPAPISEELALKIKNLAVKTFKVIDGCGVARVDFLINKNNEPFVNEINTIPGSLAFYLWQEQGIDFPQLLDRLIELGFKAYQERNKTVYTYETKILKGKF